MNQREKASLLNFISELNSVNETYLKLVHHH